MADFIHHDLAGGRWFGMALCEQLGNVGSEVGRAIKWQREENTVRREKSLERALELLDLTIADQRWQGRLKEICRAREVVTDFFYGNNQYQGSPESLEKYFYQFAQEARK